MSPRPTDAELAEMLRAGADAVMFIHSERCLSRDKCCCQADADRMDAAADALSARRPSPEQEAERP